MSLANTQETPGITGGSDRVEIRVLGPLRVRRADGSDVGDSAWRTRKTVDLLRLLALRVGHPVPVTRIIECLWPDVPEHRGRASLRTAASTIRQVLGAGCVQRRQDGLELRDVWVDAVAFMTLAREVRGYERENMPARVVAAAREAEALYLDDLRAADESSSWAADERAQLQGTYRSVLEDAAEAALALGWNRDAASFATRAIALDPCAERPVRTLMTACAHLGQLEQSLRAFQQCRRALAEELGVDPSPQTDTLHVKVLTGEVAPAPLPRPRFICRQIQLQQVVGALAEAGSRDLPTVVELRGEDGCGRRRLLDEACARSGSTWEAVGDLSGRPPAGAVRFVDPGVLARLAEAPVAPAGPGLPAGTGVTVATGDTTDEVREELVQRGWTWYQVSLPRLSHDEVAALVAEVLGGPVSPSLVDDVTAHADGTPASVVTLARAHLRSGRVRSTNDGLTLVPADAVQDVDAQAVLARALEQLPPDEHEVLHAVALLDSPIGLDALLPALSGAPTRPAVRRTMDHLVDMELLTAARSGYHFRHPLIASAVRAWVRPSVRRALHAQIAERAVLPATERIHHWLKAGEPQLACAAAIDASTAALAADRPAEARECLLQARALSTMLGTDPADQAELGEQLGEVCVRLGRFDEAADVYAFTLREAVGVPVARRERLVKRQKAAARGLALVGPPPAPRGTRTLSWTLPQLGEELGLTADDGPSTHVEEVLRTALREATVSTAADAGDRAAGMRVLLVNRVLIPRRQLTRAKQVLEPVVSLTTRPDLLGRATVSMWLPGVLLGDARAARAPLAASLTAVDDPQASSRLRLLLLLAAHDLGTPPADPVDDPARPSAGSGWRWLVLRTLSEAGRLEEAEAWCPDGERPRNPLLRQLEALATAELHEACGRRDDATAVLRAAADGALATGTILLLPEIAARLVILASGLDEHRTQEDFDLMDWALGGEPAHPRETYFRLLARAHVRAQNGQPERAAVAASSARAVAAEHGLTVLEGRAERVGRALHAMERRRRANDLTGEPWDPVPPGSLERRTQFPNVRAMTPPNQRGTLSRGLPGEPAHGFQTQH